MKESVGVEDGGGSSKSFQFPLKLTMLCFAQVGHSIFHHNNIIIVTKISSSRDKF